MPGPPVVVLPGLTGDNADPTGRDRRPGIKPGATLRDLADDYAAAIDRQFRTSRPP